MAFRFKNERRIFLRDSKIYGVIPKSMNEPEDLLRIIDESLVEKYDLMKSYISPRSSKLKRKEISRLKKRGELLPNNLYFQFAALADKDDEELCNFVRRYGFIGKDIWEVLSAIDNPGSDGAVKILDRQDELLDTRLNGKTIPKSKYHPGYLFIENIEDIRREALKMGQILHWLTEIEAIQRDKLTKKARLERVRDVYWQLWDKHGHKESVHFSDYLEALNYLRDSTFDEIRPYVSQYLVSELSADGSLIPLFIDAPLISQLYYFILLDLQKGYILRCGNETCQCLPLFTSRDPRACFCSENCANTQNTRDRRKRKSK